MYARTRVAIAVLIQGVAFVATAAGARAGAVESAGLVGEAGLMVGMVGGC
jgi:hypothetical protein